MSERKTQRRLAKQRPTAWDGLDLIVTKLEHVMPELNGEATITLSAAQVTLLRSIHKPAYEDPDYLPMAPPKPAEDA